MSPPLEGLLGSEYREVKVGWSRRLIGYLDSVQPAE
jgi:hypothetical protein